MERSRIEGACFGVIVVVEVPDELAGSVRRRLPPDWQPGPAASAPCWGIDRDPSGRWFVEEPDGGRTWFSDPDSAVDRLVSGVELWVAEHARGLVLVHAGCVALDGRALVLPGRSRTGKSTLVAALLAAGADYLSDEYAVLQPDGRVRPYRRPVALREESGRGKRHVRVDQPTSGAADDALPVGLIARLVFEPGATWSVRWMSRGETALALLENCVAARTRPQEAMDHAVAATAQARGLRGRRGEAASAAAELLAVDIA